MKLTWAACVAAFVASITLSVFMIIFPLVRGESVGLEALEPLGIMFGVVWICSFIVSFLLLLPLQLVVKHASRRVSFIVFFLAGALFAGALTHLLIYTIGFDRDTTPTLVEQLRVYSSIMTVGVLSALSSWKVLADGKLFGRKEFVADD